MKPMEKSYYQHMSKQQWRAEKSRLKSFCRKYHCMMDKLEAMEENLRPGSPNYDGMPKAKNTESSVEKKAIRLSILQDNIDMLHLAAEQTDFKMAKIIVDYVSSERPSYNALKSEGKISVSRAVFFQRIDKFYRCLYQLRCESANCSILRQRIKQGKARKDWSHRKIR